MRIRAYCETFTQYNSLQKEIRSRGWFWILAGGIMNMNDIIENIKNLMEHIHELELRIKKLEEE